MKSILLLLLIAFCLAAPPSLAQTYGNTPALVARFECPPAPNQGAFNLVIPDLQYFYAAGMWQIYGPPLGTVTQATVSINSQGGNGMPPEYSAVVIPNNPGSTYITTGVLGDTTKSYQVSIVYTTDTGYNIRYNTGVYQPHEGWWTQSVARFNQASYSGYLGCSNITPAPAGSPQDYWYTYSGNNGNGPGNNNGGGGGKGHGPK